MGYQCPTGPEARWLRAINPSRPAPRGRSTEVMIGFVSCVASQDKYRQFAVPGLRRAVEPDSIVAEASTDCSIFEAYNEALDAFAPMEALEALVFLHEDTELLDDDFCTRLRSVFSDE